jgi:hypothetical protein
MWLRLFVVAGLCLALDLRASERDRSQTCQEAVIFVTDHPERLEKTVRSREHLYTPGLRNEWMNAKAEFSLTEDGEEVLVIRGLEVMRGFEKPYMATLARTAARGGGKVLNVGYGIGFIDEEIERLRCEFPVSEHHIIELNAEVVERALKWREGQPHREKIFIHQGDWQDVLERLARQGVVFDSVAYDAFPLEKQELHRDFVPFLESVLRLKAVKEGTGLITFYMDSPDGFGLRFTQYAKSLGVGELALERVSVQLPSRGNQYWERDYFFTPSLTAIAYGS